MKPPFFVVNPRSDGGRTGSAWPRVEARLRRELGDLRVAFTAAGGEAAPIARRALEGGHELVVAVGGDGTINEVVNGFFEGGRPVTPGAALGILQRGTGGDFRRTLGLEGTLDGYVRALVGGSVRRVDVGRLTFVDHQGRERERYFLNIASFGVGGVFDQYLNRSRRVLAGRFATTWAGLRAAASYRNQPVRLCLDGGAPREVRVHNVAVANGRYYGGAMQVAPQAQLDDGLFDVVVLGDLRLSQIPDLARRIYAGTHLGMRQVEHARARRVQAESDEVVLLDVDGEQPGRLPASFEVVPGALLLKAA